MTEVEIRSKICELRSQVETLVEEARALWEQNAIGRADSLNMDDLQDIADAMAELEND